MGRQGENPQPDRDSMPRSFDRTVRMAIRPALLVVALATMGNLATAQQPGIDGPSKALEGRWKLELYLDKPSARVEPMAGQINGEIGFSTLAWWNPSDRFGRHTLNLQSFFGNSFRRPDVAAFSPADTSMVTEVSGNVRGDSVGIDFIPRVDHGGLSMWGRFWGDSAKGRWYRRGSDGEGHFVLRRLSKDPVTVALIPDGRPTVVAAVAPPAKKLTKAEARALARKEAAAKAKARSDSIAVARAEAQKKAKEEALAKAAARDSAKAVALAEAKAKKAAQDSVRAQAVADAKAKRDAAAQAKLAANTPAKPTDSATRSVTTVASGGATGATGAALPNALASAPTAGDSRTSRASAPSTPVRVASASPAPTAATRTSAPDAAAPAATADASTAVPLRVRIFDEASKKYFVTTYSLHLPDGHWLYGKLRTGNGPDGFGPAVPRTPGKYEIEITNFMCGDKLWFFKDKILQTVEVTPGTPADVTINVNLPEAPARPSLENKAGEKCAVPVS